MLHAVKILRSDGFYKQQIQVSPNRVWRLAAFKGRRPLPCGSAAIVRSMGRACPCAPRLHHLKGEEDHG